MIKDWELQIYEERLTELGLFSLKEERLRVNLINVYKYLMGVCKEDKIRLSSVVFSDRTRGNEHKLKHWGFHLDIKKCFLTADTTLLLQTAARKKRKVSARRKKKKTHLL